MAECVLRSVVLRFFYEIFLKPLTKGVCYDIIKITNGDKRL